MENEALSIDSFAGELAAAEQLEQPTEESSQPVQEPVEEGNPEEALEPLEGEEGEVEQPVEESAGDERVHKWETANGEKFEVNEKELRDGYLREQDYRQKTQNAAETVRTEQSKVQQSLQVIEALAVDIGTFQAMQQRLAQFQQVDWNRLQMEDPQQASTLRTEQLLLLEQARGAQGALKEKHLHLTSTLAQQLQQRQVEAADYLRSKVPKVDIAALNEACLKAGHSRESLSSIADKALVHDLWKARQWDALQAKKPEVQNRVRTLPPASAGKPARVTAPPSKTEAIARALKSNAPMSTREYAKIMGSL